MEPMIELIADGLAFPEGPCFDANGDLHLTQCDNGWIARVREGAVEQYLHTGRKPNGAVFSEDNVLWIAEAGTNQLLRYDGTQLVEVVAECDGQPLREPNDLIFAPDGSIYMTGPGGSREEPVGVVYHAQRDGTIEIAAGGMRFPNGLALTADASHLLVSQSGVQDILVFDVRKDGSLDGPAVFAATPDAAGADGVALDVEGNLYVAHFGTGRIPVFSPEGELLDRLPGGGLRPTNLAFGGPGMTHLYVTEVESGAVYRLRPGVAGLVPFCDPRPPATD